MLDIQEPNCFVFTVQISPPPIIGAAGGGAKKMFGAWRKFPPPLIA